ncbi:hypothetical protein VC83_03883 [Pseudogymnoascus destructans]|uniref:Uncharacterized protein n=1 Tax=Pseudogymnoascus destructans TaxID=655981 RepID=A0A177AEB3_9PEZI|nr:uncharacterized protein VC83_03883 [Pseudogymnoascus destructans]OAF59523.1 hypothetical protein VC83_03883 [Pseudogymnoascus destructans]
MPTSDDLNHAQNTKPYSSSHISIQPPPSDRPSIPPSPSPTTVSRHATASVIPILPSPLAPALHHSRLPALEPHPSLVLTPHPSVPTPPASLGILSYDITLNSLVAGSKPGTQADLR